MATKKQRRRREKGRRHEYEFVYVDPEGQEVEVDEPDEPEKPKPEKKPAAGSKTAAAAKTKTNERVPQAPTWERTLRRAAIFAPFILIFVYLTKSSSDSMTVVLLRSLPLIILIVPFMFLVDSMAYRGWQKRQAKKSAGSRPKSK